jgi:nucleoside-diphosphate-sugar epimerase
VHVLVIGGTRFTGPRAVRALVERGHDVTVFHRGESEADLPAEVRHVHADVAAFESYVGDLRARAPDMVVDMVAFRREDVRRVLAFSGVADCAVVASSADVYRAFGRVWRTEPGPPDPLPLTEDSPLREQLSLDGLAYDKTGVETELRAQSELPVTILRLPAMHGPGDQQHRLYPYLRRMAEGRPAILLDEAIAPWRWVRGYSEDVAHAIALAVLDPRATGRTYNVAYAVAHSELEWVREIGRVAGWEGEVVTLPSEGLPEGLRRDRFDLRQDYVVDSTRIREELGYSEQVLFDEALRRTIEWELANPPRELDPADYDYQAEDAALSGLRPET